MLSLLHSNPVFKNPMKIKKKERKQKKGRKEGRNDIRKSVPSHGSPGCNLLNSTISSSDFFSKPSSVST